MGPVLTNALAFWERGRLAYNLVLGALVVQYFALHPMPEGTLPVLFVLAVAANACYCAAYLVDVPVQLSEFRHRWLPHRWMLWALGTATAATLTCLTCPQLPRL